MAGTVTTRIITGGLGPNIKACEGLITTHFSLYCVAIPAPPIRPPSGGGGGPYPGPAWNKVDNISNFYQPVHGLYDPTKRPKVQKQVVLKIDIGNIHVERFYMVPIERADRIVKVLNLVNAARAKYKIAISRLHSVVHNIKVSVKNFRKKD